MKGSDQRERGAKPLVDPGHRPAGLITRRRVLTALAAGSVAAAYKSLNVPTYFLDVMGRWNQAVDRFAFSAERMAPEAGLSDITPDEDFPSYFISSTMPFRPTGWTLKVGGLVARPMVISLEDLHRMTRSELRVRHHCVEGWSAVASWHGVRLRDLAEAAGAAPHARYVEFRSFDSGYWSSWDRESARHPQTILAYGMNGRPLYADHGAPLRVYTAVKLGYKMVKYLTEVNFLPEPSGGYWEDQGYEWFAGL